MTVAVGRGGLSDKARRLLERNAPEAAAALEAIDGNDVVRWRVNCGDTAPWDAWAITSSGVFYANAHGSSLETGFS
jgi:hypothetical protein